MPIRLFDGIHLISRVKRRFDLAMYEKFKRSVVLKVIQHVVNP